MNKNLSRLLWRHYRKRLIAMLLITVLVGLFMANADADTWTTIPGHGLFTDKIHQWQLYSNTGGINLGIVNLYPSVMYVMFWLAGTLFMNQDLKDHFNQFLFSSGYRRGTIYWHRLVLVLGSLLALTAITIAVSYGWYWVKLEPDVAFNLAWPGVLTAWGFGLAISLGLFAIGWFAALIIGQTGPLVVTSGGFVLSLIAVAGIISSMLWHRQWSMVATEWFMAGLSLVGTLILVLWGAWLYQRLSLEHNGEYLLFPKLRLPVYLVFVTYVTAVFGFGGSFSNALPVMVVCGFTLVFGYFWLWGTSRLKKHRRRAK